jgi:hypothetical protein
MESGRRLLRRRWAGRAAWWASRFARTAIEEGLVEVEELYAVFHPRRNLPIKTTLGRCSKASPAKADAGIGDGI